MVAGTPQFATASWLRNDGRVATGARILDAAISDSAGTPFPVIISTVSIGRAAADDLQIALHDLRFEYGRRVSGGLTYLIHAPMENVDARSVAITVADYFDRTIVLSSK
jgi:hypothetical protein